LGQTVREDCLIIKAKQSKAKQSKAKQTGRTATQWQKEKSKRGFFPFGRRFAISNA